MTTERQRLHGTQRTPKRPGNPTPNTMPIAGSPTPLAGTLARFVLQALIYVALSFLAWLALSGAVAADTGLYSFEQECATGFCPDTAGPASCVAVGTTQSGKTCVVTAKHCVRQSANVFYVVNKNGRKRRAIVVWRSPDLDIAALVVNESLSTPPVRYSDVEKGESFILKGVISRRAQVSEGKASTIERSGRTWFRGFWSHAGMSGGAIYDTRLNLVGIHHSKVQKSDETIGVTGAGFREAINQFERRYGKLQRKIEQQQGRVPLCQRCGDPRCPFSRSQTTSNACRVEVNYNGLADELFAKYGDRMKGEPGRNGANGEDGLNGSTPQIDVDELANVITARYADRIRGPRGNDGVQGLQGDPGLVGVPSSDDIRNWLVGASSDPETRAMLATIFADLVAADPRTANLIERLERIEQRVDEPIEFPPVPDIAALRERVTKLETPRRFVIVDGEAGAILDDESYAVDEPFVLDVQKLLKAKR